MPPSPALISPFAGVFYPISTLPQWMQVISHLLPPSYIFESIRAIVSGGAASGMGLRWGGGLAGVVCRAGHQPGAGGLSRGLGLHGDPAAGHVALGQHPRRVRAEAEGDGGAELLLPPL